MVDGLYTQGEVASIFRDVPNKTLIYWARQGLVEWAAETRDARGIARIYNRWNLSQIVFVRELAGLGISIANIRHHMEMFKDFPQLYPYQVEMFKDFPQIHSYDDEGKEIPRAPVSESFYSESGPIYLVILKKVTDRDWQDPIAAAVGTLNTLKMAKKAMGKAMSLHTTVTINLSALDDYVSSLIQEAGLS
jgi:DNA-binding transcriptional MerR regulator